MTLVGPRMSSCRSQGCCLSEADFATIKGIAEKEAGLLLPESKRLMVQSRLARRVRATGHAGISDYVATIKSEKCCEELTALVSALTTNVTSFFRETHHFETLANSVLPGLIESARAGRRVRLWSAGCSSGEEPYSLALLISSMAPDVSNLDLRILATDIDESVLSRARIGHYAKKALSNLPFGLPDTGGFDPVDDELTSVPDGLRQLVSFKKLNLHVEWPMKAMFDVILCRNVVIYFDAKHQAALWPRFSERLVPNGWLFLGHSERIHPLEGSGFSAEGLTTYRKTSAAQRPRDA